VGMDANGSCCGTRGQNIALAPVPPYAPEHTQNLALCPHESSWQAPATMGVQHWTPLEAPPPKSSSGGSSILRI
jgi:hypothetical protein